MRPGRQQQAYRRSNDQDSYPTPLFSRRAAVTIRVTSQVLICKRGEKADLQRPDTRTGPPKSCFKKSRTHACVSDFLKKVRSIPRSGDVYSCFILAFLEQQLGNFSRNSLWSTTQAKVQPSLPNRRTALDPVGDVNCCVQANALIDRIAGEWSATRSEDSIPLSL